MDRITGKAIEGADHLRQSIADRLFTPLGTRIGRRGYGSHIPALLDQPLNDATRIRLFAATALAMLQEPRVRVARVALEFGEAHGGARLIVVGRRTDVADAAAPFIATMPLSAPAALV
ncbi:GPW/gp25 family protein [Sphingomonas melonis]|uniref:GPW/gp25 family protein n=1 Tax=Sphingomonas melonis TaxID=152682 RepID=UPI0035C86544